MSEKPYILDFKEEDNPIAIKDIISKYTRYWPWFLVSCTLFVLLGHFYANYAPKTYSTVARIKILDDDKEPKIVNNDKVSSNPNVNLNLENQVQVLKSFRLLAEVVEELKLDVVCSKQNKLNYVPVLDSPFVIEKTIDDEEIEKPLTYEIVMSSSGFKITDKDGNTYSIPYGNWVNRDVKLPFNISLDDIDHVNDFKDDKYKIVLMSKGHATLLLSEKLKIGTSEKQGDVLSLSLKGANRARTEAILNSIINNFGSYNVEENRMDAQRVLSQIDKRFMELSGELDSIELGKEDYKQLEDLSNIQADAGVSLSKRANNESEVLRLTTQISSIDILKKSLNGEEPYSLLASDIGLTNQTLSVMAENYNVLARERQKLILSAGNDHPMLKSLSERLDYEKENILETLRVYESQMRTLLKTYNAEKYRSESAFAQLPEKERILRSIDRQQNIKEDLYMLLLRKREETAIDYATATTSVRVIDYGVSDIKPLWPKKVIVYPLSLLLGFIFPLGFIYLKSAINNTVNGRNEIEEIDPKTPVLIEIPLFDRENIIEDFKEGSVLVESFRILGTNTDYLIPKRDETKVVYITSSVKGEGKTMTALNLSLAFSSVGKRVLLVGADLRNPQLHSYLNLDRNAPGLSDYLKNPSFDFKSGIQLGFKKNPNHHVYLSGIIPENAPVLLSSKRFSEFLDEAKKNYDYVVVDTAPTILVTDTLLISNYADITLFVVRSGFTDRNLLQHSKELNRKQMLKNMAYVVNAVGNLNGYKYNYGYKYGYDFEDKAVEKSWKKQLLNILKKFPATIRSLLKKKYPIKN